MSRLSRLLRWVNKSGDDSKCQLQHHQRVCLLHIMKTAGTSLRLMLEDALGSEAICPNSAMLSKQPHGWYLAADEVVNTFSSLPPHRLLIGHFPANILSKLSGPYVGAVFLRDPVQRSLSALAHEARLLHSTPFDLMQSTDFVRTRILDYQTKILGCQGIDNPNQHDRVDDETLDRALQQIDDLAFVGITERFIDSCRVFDAQFRTSITKKAKRENVLRPNGCEHDDLISLVKPFVQRDYVLYERAKARFEQDLKKYVGSGGEVPHGSTGFAERRSISSDVSNDDSEPSRSAA